MSPKSGGLLMMVYSPAFPASSSLSIFSFQYLTVHKKSFVQKGEDFLYFDHSFKVASIE